MLYLDLLKATAESYTPQPNVRELQVVHDVKIWLTPFIEPLHGHSTPHCFKFTLNGSEQAVMHYKNWSSDLWSKEGLVLLKVGFDVHNKSQCKVNSVSLLILYTGYTEVKISVCTYHCSKYQMVHRKLLLLTWTELMLRN